MAIPKRISAKRAEEARQCYELDLAGFSQRQIAEKVGISQTTVHNRIHEHIQNRVHRKADEWRDRQLDDLMVMRRKLVKSIESGDIKAIGQAVRIWERISKLCGLDSATLFKMEAQVVSKESDANDAQRLMDQFFGANPAEQRRPVIKGEVITTNGHTRPRRKSAPPKPLAYATPEPDEFAAEPDALEEFDIEPAEPEPAPRPRRKRGQPIPNPAAQFLRDSDD
ncbi:sigma factor-like helix-turn-helix DNA-binding protein [Streptomyces sp. NPDC059452]|uniref:sigma factor-like helix-turn-helix DNA-binding protein n=1 Tax=Streptomyces sp. NPDC059452 TaxID=3346835 RepID=UPI00369DD9EA